MSMIISFVGTGIICCSEVFSWFIISKSNYDKKKILNYILIFLFVLSVFVNHNYVNSFVKGFLTLFLEIFFCNRILKISIKSSIFVSFISQIIIIVSEAFVYAILSIGFSVNVNNITNYIYSGVLLDIVIASINIIISRFRFFHLLYVFLLNITKQINIKQILILVLFVVFGTNVFTTSVYFNSSMFLKLVLNIMISLIYTIIIIMILKYQNKYYKIESKYKLSLNDLQEQEKMINNYRIINHENRNQLMTIRSMCKNKSVIGYINSIIDDKNDMKNSLVSDILSLPTGGIRGLVYSKLSLINEKKIKYYLNIDKKFSKKDIRNLSDSDIADVCNILGVLIDNAIEEVENMPDGVINIDFHISKDKLSILISNNYIRKDNNQIDNQLFKSKKGIGRGYGLKLVKKIVDDNNKITNSKEISKNVFIQKVFIDI